MTGKNHIITNTGTLICIGSGVAWLNKAAMNIAINTVDSTANLSFLQSVIVGGNNIIQQFLTTTFLSMGNLPKVLFCVLVLSTFYIGTLAPDIDSENSMLGKFFYLPIEHRTWTHAVWIPIIFGLLALLQPIFWWFVFGYMGHLIWDNASRGGVCFFYPITKYRHFGNTGAKIKDGHFLYLYRTGQTSEYVVMGIVVAITICVVVLDIVCGLF